MKSQPVELLEFVEADLRYAWNYYDSWLEDGAKHFQGRFRETLEWIEWNPEQFPTAYRQFRRAIVKRSYFALFFVQEPGVTTVVAVLDMRQNPRMIKAALRVRKPTIS